MTGEQIQSVYFSPWMYILYLSVILFFATIYLQYVWHKKSREFVKVLVVKVDGDTDVVYAPKKGNYVELTSPHNKSVRLWPISKVCAIEEYYPGDGFIPKILQKKIKTVIVDEEDWEPLLNRGSYSQQVASPDVVKFLREALEDIKKDKPDFAKKLDAYVNTLATAPTRKMIASTAVLGNLLNEKITEAVLTVNKETFEKLEAILARIGQMVNPTIVYVGLGLVAILAIVSVFFVKSLSGQVTDLQSELDAIRQALGVTS